jgi:hypothetical protein
LNIHKQIYARPNLLEDVPLSPKSKSHVQAHDDDNTLSHERVLYETVADGFHQGAITFMDVAI